MHDQQTNRDETEREAHRGSSGVQTLDELIALRAGRRGVLKSLAALAMGTTGSAGLPTAAASPPKKKLGKSASTLDFAEVSHGLDERAHVSAGHSVQVLIRWGDPVLPGAPEFDVHAQSPEAQAKQFGYNNDFVAFLPLPRGSNRSDHGLLCVNHEYTNAHLMFPGIEKKGDPSLLTREQVDIEMAAHGHSVVEIRRRENRWQIERNSRFNRRITVGETEITISGPAAGHPRLKTSADPTGMRVIGSINNCAGGVTPWGTVLFSEENFHVYFGGNPEKSSEARNHRRYGLVAGGAAHGWYRFHDRFDVDKEPHEPNRFGWVVEYDPYDPQSTPVKRTALGRMQHEGATCSLAADGRVVVYGGDDSHFEYLYRFVTKDNYDANDRDANRDLLDEGTLFVARFDEDGTVRWLPLEFGKGPLVKRNGFDSQADVLIETRRAADLLGATPMDRPEDVEENPGNGRVYVMLTNNTKRNEDQTDPMNPRAANKHGHIIELTPPKVLGKPDHGATQFRWDVFLLAGDPAEREDGARCHEGVSTDGWLSCPDNCTFDANGRLWIATDGFPKSSGIADGVFACDTDGPGRALTRRFFRAPRGAEICGPAFTPDGTTLFLAIQHPGEESGSTFDRPSTRWPDFSKEMPPRPSIIAVVQEDGSPIGG